MESPLRSRDFARLWGAALLSNFGSMVRVVALPFTAVLVLDAEPRHIALLSAASLLPGFLFGLFAAPWIDRLQRRRILVVSDLARAALLASVTGAAWLGWLSMGQLYVVAFASGALAFLFDVAHVAYLPSLVKPAQLLAANSRIKAAEAATEGAGFASAGWLVQIFGAPLALLIDSVSFLASAALIGGIRSDEGAPREPRAGRAGLASEIAEGLRELGRSPVLRPLTVAAALRAFAYQLVGVVYLIYVTRELGFEPGPLGLVFAVGAGSSLVGALAAPRARARLGAGPAMWLGLALACAALALLPLAPAASIAGLAVLVVHQLADGADVVYDVNQTSVRQQVTPERLLGRVNGGIRFAELGAMLAGSAAGAVLGETWGLRPTLVAGTVAMGLAALLLGLSRAGQLGGDPDAWETGPGRPADRAGHLGSPAPSAERSRSAR